MRYTDMEPVPGLCDVTVFSSVGTSKATAPERSREATHATLVGSIRGEKVLTPLLSFLGGQAKNTTPPKICKS